MMKEETQVNTYTDAPCKDFIPHRFKTSHCVNCFKPKSLHVQDNPEQVTRQTIKVPVIEINSNNTTVTETENKSAHRKFAARTNNNNAILDKSRQLEDGVLDRSMLAGKTRQLRKQFECQAATSQKKQPLKQINMNDKNKNSAMASNREQKGPDFVMNVPIEASVESEIKDLNSNSNHNGAINDHYESDSDSDVLSEPMSNSRFWSKKWSPKPTRAMDPIPSPMSDDSSNGYVDLADDDYVDLADDANIPVLKSIHPLNKEDVKSSSESSPEELQQIRSNRLKEFQQVAQHLRHVDPPQDSPTVKRRPVKTHCPKAVLPSNGNIVAHMGIQDSVNDSKKAPMDVKVAQRATSPIKSNKSQKMDNTPVDVSKLDLAGKPVTIKYRDGTVAHYDGSPRSEQSPVRSNNNQSARQQSPTKPKPYVVVDISGESPRGLSTRDRRSISGPSLPCTPSPRSRPISQHSSHESGDAISRSNSVDSALTGSTETVSDISVAKHSAGTPETKMRTDDDSKGNTPPYPMLLGNGGHEPPALPVKNRRQRQERPNSSGYKVPIFIQPQNYDNLGTAKSDSETQLNLLAGKTPEGETAPTPPVRSDSSDYLVPMRDSIGSNASGELNISSGPGSRDSGRFSASDNESKASSQGACSDKFDEYRRRAQSHPPEQQKPEPVYAKIQGKQKRTAPAPPGDPEDSDSSFLDTLPREPPPPPPPPSTKDKGLVVDFPRKQAPNIYSQSPRKKQAPEASNKESKPERPKVPPPISPEKVLGSNKGQAPRLNAEAMRQIPSEPSTKLNLDKAVSPPQKFSHSVKVLPTEPAAVLSPRKSAPVRAKEPSSSKAKAPVPSQIHNVLSSQSPSKSPAPKQNQVTSIKQSPPSKRTKSPLEKEVPLQSPSKKSDVQSKAQSNNDAAEGNGSHARTIAPLPPYSPLSNRKGLNLPDDTITGGPASTSKSKKVKLPWKRRNKRKEDGSPEREFNAEPVQKWLDEIQKMQLEDSKTNRHSLERLDVINAYKKQPTANIKLNGDENGSALPVSPLARTDSKEKADEAVAPRKNSDASSASPKAKPRKNSDATEQPVPRPRKNSAVKRQAPRPPSGMDGEEKVEEEDDDDEEEEEDDFVDVSALRKSNSSSPISRDRNGSEGDNGNVYENVGIQRQDDAPPYKPTRRARNHTTGFEDLPSQKRMAPKAPCDDQKAPLCRQQSLSDQDLRKIPASKEEEGDPVPPPRKGQSDVKEAIVEDTSTSPVKSAKTEQPEKSKTKPSQNKSDSDGIRVFSDGIRVFASGTANRKGSNGKSKTANIDNMEYLMTSDLKLGEKASIKSFYRGDDSSEEELSTCKMDAAVQCSLPYGNGNSKPGSMHGVIDTMLEMNRRTLSTVLSAWKDKIPKKWWTNETNWGELIDRDEPCWCDEETVIYGAFPKEKHNSPLPVMIPLKGETDKIVQVAEFTKALIPPHPNLYTVHAVSSLNFVNSTSTSPNPYTSSSDPKVPTDIPAIVIDKPPIMSLSAFVKENQQYHLEQGESYEEDISLVLLQLCSAIHHLQRNQLSLQRVDIEHVHLAQRTGCEKQVILNHLLSRLHTGMSKDGKILATPEQINLKTGEFSLGVMTYELLHCPSPFATKESLIFQDYRASDLPAIPNRSKYSKFLHTLASQFLTKRRSERLTAGQGALALQTMLWGPQLNHLPNLVQNPREMSQALQQWLMIAQAGVVNKVAEEAAVAGRQGVKFGLKDQMKCQFLSEVTVDNLMEGMTLLYFKRS